MTSEIPWPLDSGGHLRTYHLLQALSRQFRVRLLVPLFPGQDHLAEALRERGIMVCPAPVACRAGCKEVFRVAAALCHREPYVLYRRHDHRAMHREWRRQLAIERPEVLYLDHLDSLLYADPRLPVPFALDLHNVYSMLASRTATEQRWGCKRLYLAREARLLEQIERGAAARAGRLITVSDEEGRYFRGLGAREVRVVPNGVDCQAFAGLPTGRQGNQPLIVYLGAMSWVPNVRAAVFLAREVLPRLRQQDPAVRLRIVGRDPNPEVEGLRGLQGVEVTGTVKDIVPHLREARILAVPLESGGGTRLKILEAFAAGLPVVSTPIGCEGLHVDHGKHLLIAGRDQFAATIAAVLAHPEMADRLAVQARVLARRHYDWTIVGQVACDVVWELIPSLSR